MLVKPMMRRLPTDEDVLVGNLDSLGLRLQKQTLHLLALRAELLQRLSADGASMSEEEIEGVGPGKLFHADERLGSELDRGVVTEDVAHLLVQSQAAARCQNLSLNCHPYFSHAYRALLRVGRSTEWGCAMARTNSIGGWPALTITPGRELQTSRRATIARHLTLDVPREGFAGG